MFAATAPVPLGSDDHRSRLLPVCMGAIALSLVAFSALVVQGAAVAALCLVCLVGTAILALWTRHRIQATEARLQAAVEEREALDRANSDLRRFAFAVAHDLRAPLVSTKGMLTIAKEVANAGDLGDVIRLLDRASNNAQRMDGVISGILDLATGEADRSDTVDLDEVLTHSLDDLCPALMERGFDVRRDEPLGLVRGDERHIQRVFDNLVGNAVKYVRPPLPGQAPILAVRATRLRRSVRVTISDNGPGIPPDRRQEVLEGHFDPSGDSANNRQHGFRPVSGANLGLGLPLAKLAIEDCGGSLAIRTSPMGGTEFVLDFQADPCVIPDQTPSTLTQAPSSATRKDHSSYLSRTMLTTG